MAGSRSLARISTSWLLVTMVFVLLAPAVPHSLAASSGPVRVSYEASPTSEPGNEEPTIAATTAVRLPAGPAVDEGSSGPNVRARTDRRGTDEIPEITVSPTEDTRVPRLNDPVLRWLPEIVSSGEKWGVPAEILAGIIRIESQGEPGPISPAGARGLVQMMPDGLRSHGVPEGQWHDPATNIDAGAWGLAWRFDAQGSWQGAVGAYLGFGCDVYGTCTDVYVRIVMQWADYYRPIIADPRNSGLAILPDDWAYGPIHIFQMPNPPTPEPPPTETETTTPTETGTPKPGEPTTTPQPDDPTNTPVPDEPTSVPTEPVDPTVVPPTEIPTVAPTEAPTVVPTEPPPPPPTDVPPTEVPQPVPTGEVG